MRSRKKRRISNDVKLVALGITIVVALQQCDSNDDCRYVYASKSSCESDWGYGACRTRNGKFYGPDQKECPDSHHSGGAGGGSGGFGGKGEHAVGVERGGFGGSGSRFGSGS